MNKRKEVLTRILPCLALLLTACSTPIALAGPAPQLNAQQPPLPAPLQVIFAQGFNAGPNGQHPPPDFGKSIALGDGVLAVGAPSQTGGEEFSAPGSVYVYRRGANSWEQEAQLKASNEEDGTQKATHFGASLALQDQTLLVGAPDADDPQAGSNSGAVYVFEAGPDGWHEAAILQSPQPVAEGKFGYTLAADGNQLCVMEGYFTQANRLWLFQRKGDQWSQTALIEPAIPEGWTGGISTFDLYGDLLALSVMYRQGEEAQTAFSGTTLIYRFDGVTWVESGELPNLVANQLALDGIGPVANRLAVASILSTTGFGMGDGRISVYTRQEDNWILEDTLGSPDSGSTSYWYSGFGAAVALQGDLLVAGAPMYSEDSSWDGVAYLYQFYQGHWVEQLRLVPTEDGGEGDFFGHALIYGNTVLVAAPDEFGHAAYVYEVGPR